MNSNPKFDRLDILLCNAGVVMKSNRMKTMDGFEMHFGVNHLAHFHLSNELKNIMENTYNKYNQYSRLIVVSSIVHRSYDEWYPCLCNKEQKVCFNEFSIEKVNSHNESTDAYSHSKLCNVMFVKHWTEIYKFQENSNIIAVSLHPGFGITNLGLFDNLSDLDDLRQKWFGCFVQCFFKFCKYVVLDTQNQLAFTQVWCCLTDIHNLKAGAYYRSKKTKRVAKCATDTVLCKQLWDKSAEFIRSVKTE